MPKHYTLIEAKQMAEEALAAVELDSDGWTVALIDSRDVAGRIHNKKRQLQLDREYIKASSKAEVQDTIIHEIAHLLAPPYRPKGAQRWRIHHAEWRATAIAMGGTGEIDTPRIRDALRKRSR